MKTLLDDFSVGLFIMQAIILIVLIFLMVKFAWKPILNALNTREEGIKSAIDSAEKAKLEMENLQADNKKLLNEARVERENMLKEAREMKNKIVEEAKTEAQAEAHKLVLQAQATIESERKAAIADIKNQVASLSIVIAEKVLRNELTDNKKQQQLVETLISDAKLN